MSSRSGGSGLSTGQRCFAISKIAWVDAAWSEAFEKALRTELNRGAVVVKVQTRAPLALQADKIRYTAAVAEFKPDLVLVVEPGEAVEQPPDGVLDDQAFKVLRLEDAIRKMTSRPANTFHF